MRRLHKYMGCLLFVIAVLAASSLSICIPTCSAYGLGWNANSMLEDATPEEIEEAKQDAAEAKKKAENKLFPTRIEGAISIGIFLAAFAWLAAERKMLAQAQAAAASNQPSNLRQENNSSQISNSEHILNR